jgi:nitrate/TMAO reductase-like tetraheme cytochrome c subunit
MADSTPKQSLRSRLRDFFVQPSRFSLTAVVAIGMVLGLVFWGGFNTGMEATNSLEFCTSCHEMRDTVFQEYKETIHYKNRSGVRATCPDCHVPKDWTHKFIRKVQASQELYGKFVSATISTPEKFEAKRMELAKHVWDTMKGNDSHECRNCHSWDAMDPAKQHPRARTEMQKGQKEGKTCIDCHKGIAHLLPQEYNPDEAQ